MLILNIFFNCYFLKGLLHSPYSDPIYSIKYYHNLNLNIYKFVLIHSKTRKFRSI